MPTGEAGLRIRGPDGWSRAAVLHMPLTRPDLAQRHDPGFGSIAATNGSPADRWHGRAGFGPPKPGCLTGDSRRLPRRARSGRAATDPVDVVSQGGRPRCALMHDGPEAALRLGPLVRRSLACRRPARGRLAPDADACLLERLLSQPASVVCPPRHQRRHRASGRLATRARQDPQDQD